MSNIDLDNDGHLEEIGGIKFTRTSFANAVQETISLAKSSTGMAIRLSNAYCVALAQVDKNYASLFHRGGVTYPDGYPVVVTMNRIGRHRGQAADRVRGPSYFEAVLRAGVPHGVKHFFIGTTEGTLEKLVERARQLAPGCEIAGNYAPPFGKLTHDSLANIAERVEGYGANMIWVGMGTPKQDFVADFLAERCDCPVAGVGAAFDFTAGVVRPAPVWVQRAGLEWLFRLSREPKRLARRYFWGNTVFLKTAIRDIARVEWNRTDAI